MPPTLKDLQGYFERAGISYHVLADDAGVECVITGFNGPCRILTLIENDLLICRVPAIETVSPARALACCETLLAVNYTLIIGRFGYDPRVGEVIFNAALPLITTAPSQEQFVQLIGATLVGVDTFTRALKEVLWGNATPSAAIEHAQQAQSAAITALQGQTDV